MLVANRFPGDGSTVSLATGGSFPDALSGGAHAAHVGAPLLLTAPDAVPAVLAEHLSGRAGTTQAYVYGGSVAVRDTVLDSIRELLSR